MKPIRTILLCIFLAASVTGSARAGDAAPFSARAGLDVARDAARSWAADAKLIYLENDENVSAAGTAARWGYLFYSADREEARGYTVRDGRILEAHDLDFDFEAPPLPERWIDSTDALAVAEKKAGRGYRREAAGRLSAMVLIRGAFYEEKPDATTWTFVYTSETAPSLFVVVDAGAGKVVRTWRG